MLDSARELLDALRNYAAGAPTAAGLEADPEDAATELIALGKAIAVLDGALAGAMTRYERLAAGSPAALLVQHAGLTRTEADNLRKLGHKLESDLPATRAHLTTGEIGTASARTIAALDDELAAADTPVPREARHQVEQAMAEYAADATTTEVTRAARDARYRLTPGPVERELRDQRESRGITFAKTLAGLTHISGVADPVTAATIVGYLDRHAGRLGPEDTRTSAARRLDALADAVTLAQRITATPDATPIDAPTATSAPADPAAHCPVTGRPSGDADSQAALWADADHSPGESGGVAAPAPPAGGTPALQESCSRAGGVARPVRARPGPGVTGEDPLGDGDGDAGSGVAARKRLAWRKTSPGHMLVIAGHDLLTGAPGAAPARLGDGTVIPADTARRYACEAALTRVILDAPTEPLELGRTTRLFSTSQVRALMARDQECRWTGCDAPPIACTPHHVTWWANNGATDVTNGAMLCPVHHRMVHEGRWRISWATDDPETLVIKAPAHWPHRPPPLTSPPPYRRQPRLPRAA